MSAIDDKDFKQLTDNVKRILSYLENDETTGRKGIFHDVSDLKARITAIEDRHKVRNGVIAFFSVVASFVFWILREAYVNIVK
jgi:hypothetical protein